MPAAMRSTALAPVLAIALLCPRAAVAQGSTDLFIAPLSHEDGRLQLGAPRRLTDRDGYDNQPSFEADGSILFTRIDSVGQADIFRVDPATGRVTQVTRTAPESEYSAARTPAGDRLTVVRVEADSTQRLWSFAPDGTDPRIVLTDVKPVGYYAWADAHTLALFVLGEPATLQVADTRTGQAHVVALRIGRAIQKIPGSDAISFVQQGADSTARIERLDPATGAITPLVTVPSMDGFHAWTPDGTLLTATGGRILAWRAGDESWTPVADLGPGIHDITRLAVSADGRWLAFVADHASTLPEH